MSNLVRFKSGMVTLPRSEFDRMKKAATEAAIQELLRRNQETLQTISEDVLHLVLLTGVKALIDMGCEHDFVYEFINVVADIQCSLNEGVTLDSLEKEMDEFGITLVKERL